MDCEMVSEDIFAMMLQPVMDSSTVQEDDFDKFIQNYNTVTNASATTSSTSEPTTVEIKPEPVDAGGATTTTLTSDVERIMCPCCSKMFITPKGFNRHFASVHQTIPPLGSTPQEKKKPFLRSAKPQITNPSLKTSIRIRASKKWKRKQLKKSGDNANPKVKTSQQPVKKNQIPKVIPPKNSSNAGGSGEPASKKKLTLVAVSR